MAERLKTFIEERIWFGDMEQGSFCSIVLAPDEETAERLIGLDMLKHHGEVNLAAQGAASFRAFYNQHETTAAWGDIGGTACPNCTSHSGTPSECGEQIAGVAVHECSSCAYRWVPLGFGEKREEMERSAREQIAGLDTLEVELGGGGLSVDEVRTLAPGTSVILLEETSGEGADGVERIYDVGTEGVISQVEKYTNIQGWAVTVIIGPTDGDEAIVNVFDETDSLYPFKVKAE